MPTDTTISPATLAAVSTRLTAAQATFARRYPGESGKRQPLHTVYGGAHLFSSDTPHKLGEVGRRVLAEYAPDPATFAHAIGFDPSIAGKVYARVIEKLGREPVEDYRIDFEDGYGNRSDAEEDGHAVAAARELAKGIATGTMSPFSGIRIKTFSAELSARSIRTMDLFVSTLVKASGGKVPPGFVVTLPKITSPEHVAILASLFDELEPKLGLAAGELRMEFMIETTQSLLAPDGRSMLPGMLDAARGRCVAAHFGVYDHTASCDITAAHQHMRHPVCDFARDMMKVAYAGTGLWLSDGATNIMPTPPYKGPNLTAVEVTKNRDVVHHAWRLHADDIRHSLVNGYYQGWDLHPGQLPSRYGAVYGFFIEGLAAASVRLANFVSKAAQATLVGDVFDDAATGQGLLNFFLRGINCGALTEDEALATGLTVDEVRGRSFVKILKGRKAKAGR